MTSATTEGRFRFGVPCKPFACAISALALLTGTWAGASGDCQVASDQGGMQIPVERLDVESRCLIGPIVAEHTTAGNVGPVQTPITPDLFGFFLDKPIVLAALVDRLKLGNYRFVAKGQRRYWVDDGDGTQGLLTVVYRDEWVRIYHLDGYHEGTVMPKIKAKAVVFLRLQPALAEDGRPAVRSNLVAYTQLNNAILSALVRLLRPLVGESVTRKLTRAIDVTVELGTLIAQDPERVAKEAAGLIGVGADDQKTLNGFLHAVPAPAATQATSRQSP